MIYLIKSAAFKNGAENEFEVILKIGYVGDSTKSQKSREICYLTENPTCKVLYRIPEGDLQDEFNLHCRFSYLKKPYGREWFEYNNDILDFFDTHKTKESLQELENNYSIRKLSKIKKDIEIEEIRFERYINILLSEINKDLFGISWYIEKMKLIEKYKSFNSDELREVIKSEYSLVSDAVLKRYDFSICINTSEFESFTFSNKLIFLKDIKDQSFFDSISPKFRDYYIIFGYEKLKALQFNEPSIIRERDKMLGNVEKESILKSVVYSMFEIGKKYSNNYIKSSFDSIYKHLDYNKSPKAINLGEFFKIKKVRFVDKTTRKRVNGLKIIGKK